MAATATENGAAQEDMTFLPRLTESFATLQQSPTIQTEGFCQAMALILPVFDQLGVFFQFAKTEMSGKVESLRQVTESQPTLDAVVQKCVQEKSVTTKGSTARNLHRLVSAVDFIKILMANLAKDPKMTLHNACYDAYNRTMANIHTFVVRTAVKAGMYTLPAREHFLKSIGEPEYMVAKEHAQSFVGVAEALSGNVLALFAGTAMPRSDSTFTG
mmetsp:Transcript_11756/g.35265  ORF Transcript_11756/g.35265 Transcript_11756/m.35265 type:complete len:215 (-) Transcript_11756:489-1133(-)